jgi:hypothetical protein
MALRASARAQPERRRRGIVVVVNRQPAKRRQARHLLKQFPEYAAPPELGNYSPVIYKYFAPYGADNSALQIYRALIPIAVASCSTGVKSSRNRQTPGVSSAKLER